MGPQRLEQGMHARVLLRQLFDDYDDDLRIDGEQLPALAQRLLKKLKVKDIPDASTLRDLTARRLGLMQLSYSGARLTWSDVVAFTTGEPFSTLLPPTALSELRDEDAEDAERPSQQGLWGHDDNTAGWSPPGRSSPEVSREGGDLAAPDAVEDGFEALETHCSNRAVTTGDCTEVEHQKKYILSQRSSRGHGSSSTLLVFVLSVTMSPHR